ncbi:TPA: ribosome biogenesis protein [Candidatus Micrarchaeota archaeon]|nr:ribosome biogenesis protein [Candidatus Micrarchaeota archaeon]
MKKIFICITCGKYTLKNEHCGKNTKTAHPPHFNPNDAYGKYRRKMKGIE